VVVRAGWQGPVVALGEVDGIDDLARPAQIGVGQVEAVVEHGDGDVAGALRGAPRRAHAGIGLLYDVRGHDRLAVEVPFLRVLVVDRIERRGAALGLEPVDERGLGVAHPAVAREALRGLEGRELEASADLEEVGLPEMPVDLLDARRAVAQRGDRLLDVLRACARLEGDDELARRVEAVLAALGLVGRLDRPAPFPREAPDQATARGDVTGGDPNQVPREPLDVLDARLVAQRRECIGPGHPDREAAVGEADGDRAPAPHESWHAASWTGSDVWADLTTLRPPVHARETVRQPPPPWACWGEPSLLAYDTALRLAPTRAERSIAAPS